MSEKIRLFVDLIGALSIVSVTLAAMLPEGKPKEVLKRLGFCFASAIKEAGK